jgi:hypothetical protein
VEPARRRPLEQEIPVDPLAVNAAYRRERAKRRARVQRAHARRLAGARFFAMLGVLLAISVFLGLTIWQEIQRLFGL